MSSKVAEEPMDAACQIDLPRISRYPSHADVEEGLGVSRTNSSGRTTTADTFAVPSSTHGCFYAPAGTNDLHIDPVSTSNGEPPSATSLRRSGSIGPLDLRNKSESSATAPVAQLVTSSSNSSMICPTSTMINAPGLQPFASQASSAFQATRFQNPPVAHCHPPIFGMGCPPALPSYRTIPRVCCYDSNGRCYDCNSLYGGGICPGTSGQHWSYSVHGHNRGYSYHHPPNQQSFITWSNEAIRHYPVVPVPRYAAIDSRGLSAYPYCTQDSKGEEWSHIGSYSSQPRVNRLLTPHEFYGQSPSSLPLPAHPGVINPPTHLNAQYVHAPATAGSGFRPSEQALGKANVANTVGYTQKQRIASAEEKDCQPPSSEVDSLLTGSSTSGNEVRTTTRGSVKISTEEFPMKGHIDEVENSVNLGSPVKLFAGGIANDVSSESGSGIVEASASSRKINQRKNASRRNPKVLTTRLTVSPQSNQNKRKRISDVTSADQPVEDENYNVVLKSVPTKRKFESSAESVGVEPMDSSSEAAISVDETAINANKTGYRLRSAVAKAKKVDVSKGKVKATKRSQLTANVANSKALKGRPKGRKSKKSQIPENIGKARKLAQVGNSTIKSTKLNFSRGSISSANASGESETEKMPALDIHFTEDKEREILETMRSWKLNKHEGETVLHRAATLGIPDIVYYCMSKEIMLNPNCVNMNQFAPLHDACVSGHEKVVEALLTFNAGHSKQAPGGIRPLHLAAQYGHGGIVSLLMSRGADPYVKTDKGESALDLGHESVKHLLTVCAVHPRTDDSGISSMCTQSVPNSPKDANITITIETDTEKNLAVDKNEI